MVLTTLNGHIDAMGNIQTDITNGGWSVLSDQGNIIHSMKADDKNDMFVNHKFENKSQHDALLRWSINIITGSGMHIKYDFGTISIKAGEIHFIKSIPYTCSRLLAETSVSRIMVATIII